MQLFHIGTTKYAEQLTGEGARLFGGRWNQTGDACIYTSGSRSLCLLEYLANVSMDDLPPNISITEYYLPDKLCKIVDANLLPEDWANIPPATSTKFFGSNLLHDKNCTCFAVPSVIVHAELNYILNPSAKEFHQLKIVYAEPFPIDNRIKK